SLFPAPGDCIMHRDAGACNRRAAGAAIRLNDVAIDTDSSLAQLNEVHNRAQATADQPLYLVRPAGLPAFGRLAPRARVGRAREHAVFRREPAPSLIF